MRERLRPPPLAQVSALCGLNSNRVTHNRLVLFVLACPTYQVHLEETKSTLNFASFSKKVKSHVSKNENKMTAELMKQYKKEIQDLKAKLEGDGMARRMEELLEEQSAMKEVRAVPATV